MDLLCTAHKNQFQERVLKIMSCTTSQYSHFRIFMVRTSRRPAHRVHHVVNLITSEAPVRMQGTVWQLLTGLWVNLTPPSPLELLSRFFPLNNFHVSHNCERPLARPLGKSYTNKPSQTAQLLYSPDTLLLHISPPSLAESLVSISPFC